MSGARHTPGPWAFSQVRYRRDAMDWLNITADERETFVAAVLAPSFHDDSNARLIAAAPELLEALERAARNIDAMAEALQSEQLFAAGKRAAGWADEAKQAIAKARGEA